MPGQPGAQGALDDVDLADPVQLVTRQVEQNDDAAASTASETCGTCISSTSSAAKPASRFAASAATRPASMLAPSALVATGPSVAKAVAVIRVVVDLPLVPVTMTVRRPVPSWRRIERSSVIATRPPIMAPAPRPVIRDAHRALAPTPSARRPRVVITRAV